MQNRGYLDFTDFRRFVKGLKARPELDRLHKKLTKDFGGVLTYAAFERFMRSTQKVCGVPRNFFFDAENVITHAGVFSFLQSSLSDVELQRVFVKYATAVVGGKAVQSSPDEYPMQNPLDLAVSAADAAKSAPPLPPTPVLAATSSDDSSAPSLPPPSSSSPPASPPVTWETGIMTVKGLTSFLLSTDNSAFADQNGKIYHDMTRPLPEYFISSSHNTYLVGHQLVGDSTIEGYIRALLHGARSVERKSNSFSFA